MNWFEHFSIAAGDMGNVLRFVSFGMCIPVIIAVIYGEYNMIAPMLSAPAAMFLIGTILLSIPKPEGKIPKISHALFSVALLWLISAAVCALPFTFGLGMSYIDSVFEAMSGWTDTGVTMITDIDSLPHTLIFWRSLMEWFGGLGIVAFTVALLSRTGLNPSRFYRSEARSESFIPSAIQQGIEMWKIYIIITAAAIGLIMLSGIPIWDAVNLAMTAISTGGFTPHNAGISYYDSALLEMMLIPVMIAGAIPFKIYYIAYYKRKRSLLKDNQAAFLAAAILIGCLIITWDLVTINGHELFESLRTGIFMAVSAATSTGFQTADPGLWAPSAVFILALLIFIGGSSGSTAGGVKISRILTILQGIVWWLKRTFTTANVITAFRKEGKLLSKEDAESEIGKCMLVMILYVFVIFAASILIMHLESGLANTDSSVIILEVITAACNNGINSGIISPDMNPFSKIIFIIIMWVGRLEIIPVIAFILCITKGFDRVKY